MKPLLKWVGGKGQIITEVLNEFPKQINNYVEPFVGGGSVLFALLDSNDIVITGNIYVSDINPTLINFYQTLKNSPEELIRELEKLKNEYVNSADQESYYYDLRDRFNSCILKQGASYAAMFLLLNSTCFRGVYREGPHGFNVPFGHYKKLKTIDDAHIRAASKLIQRVTFSCEDFDKPIRSTKRGDFVYVDPPYLPEKTTSFVGYVFNGFDATQHQRLFDLLKTTPSKFLMSNSDVPLIYDVFNTTFEIKTITVRRAIHSKDPSIKTQEVLVTNKSKIQLG